MKAIRTLAGMTAVGALLAVGALPAARAEMPTLKLQDYPGLGNLPFRIAREKGWCEAAGFKCELQFVNTGPLGIQALIGGSIDVAEVPIDVTTAAVLRGSKVKVVAGAAVSNLFMILAAKDTALPNESQGYKAIMTDLKGKKIGVSARGAATETMFSYLLQQAGMQPTDVTYVAVGAPNTAYAALANKQVDAAVSWEPAGIQCDLTKMCKAVWRSADAETPPVFKSMYGANTSYVMRTEQIDKDPKLVEAFVKVMQQASAYINDPAHVDEVLQLSGKYFKFDMPGGDAIARKSMALAWQYKTFTALVDRAAVKTTLDYLATTKQIATPPTVDQLIAEQAPNH